MALAKYSIKAKAENETKTIVETRGGFKIVIDEPENLGGGNEGPNPVEYLLASLAGCLNIVGHLAAKEMGFELKEMNVEISGRLDPAKFQGKSDESRAGFQQIRAEINAEADIDQETLAKWLETVESRCPVSDNIANQTPVEINLK